MANDVEQFKLLIEKALKKEPINIPLPPMVAGLDLDRIGTTYAGIERLIYDSAATNPPPNSEWDTVRNSFVESDEAYRERIKTTLAPPTPTFPICR